MNALAIHLYLINLYINLSFNNFGYFYRIIEEIFIMDFRNFAGKEKQSEETMVKVNATYRGKVVGVERRFKLNLGDIISIVGFEPFEKAKVYDKNISNGEYQDEKGVTHQVTSEASFRKAPKSYRDTYCQTVVYPAYKAEDCTVSVKRIMGDARIKLDSFEWVDALNFTFIDELYKDGEDENVTRFFDPQKLEGMVIYAPAYRLLTKFIEFESLGLIGKKLQLIGQGERKVGGFLEPVCLWRVL